MIYLWVLTDLSAFPHLISKWSQMVGSSVKVFEILDSYKEKDPNSQQQQQQQQLNNFLQGHPQAGTQVNLLSTAHSIPIKLSHVKYAKSLLL
jgi:hypothetical protein